MLASIIYVYGGWPFLTGLVGEVRKRQFGMMTLVAVAITTAYVYSLAVSVGWLHGVDFFYELATLIDIMLLGHYLEMRSVAGASRSLELIVQLLPKEAHKVDGTTVSDVAIDKLIIGDVVLVKPGERIPTDGEVVEGNSDVNQSMLTGESVPVPMKEHDSVIAGAVNGEGSLKIRVTHKGADSYLNKVVNLVSEAQNAKSKTQNLADRAAGWLTLISLSVGIITLVAWLWAGKDVAFAIERMVTVMVTVCPHALGVAIPLVVAISTSIAAQKGLLIRNRTAFENSRKITAMVFDKTGTLTEGVFGVTRIKTLAKGMDEADLLQTTAALEQQSQHPIAQSIVREAQKRTLTLPAIENFTSLPGKGVSATINGKAVAVVSPGFLNEKKIALPEDAFGSGAETVVFVLIDDKLVGYIALRKMIQNLFWATGYNVIAIPLAAGVLYPTFVLSPAMGAVLMSGSTVIVALNAELLRRSLGK